MPTNIFGLAHVPRAYSLAERLDYYSMPEPMSGCYLWLGGTCKGLYAALDWKDKKCQASRLVWELRHGPIPPDMLVCHKCDNPFCVNEQHLFLGTSQDNNDDMRRKGRHYFPSGESHYACRLSDDDVRTIRRKEEPRSVLARRYNVHPDTITSIQIGHKRRSVQ